jgi:hypothetical protein
MTRVLGIVLIVGGLLLVVTGMLFAHRNKSAEQEKSRDEIDRTENKATSPDTESERDEHNGSSAVVSNRSSNE